MKDQIFTNDELQVISKFFTIMIRATAKEFNSAKSLEEENAVSKQVLPPQNRLIPLVKWNDYHDWPGIGGLRNMVFFASINGFDKVIKRVGRRVLIDERAFFDWVKTNPNSKTL